MLVPKNNSRFELEAHWIDELLVTKMGRNLQIAQATWKIGENPIHLTLMTSHLECFTQNGPTRKKQMKQALTQMKMVNPDTTALFAGNLNIRDKEITAPMFVKSIGTLNDEINDVWVEMGRDSRHEYTWAPSLNDNNQKRKCGDMSSYRFDRVYYRNPTNGIGLKPVNFKLIGRNRIYDAPIYDDDDDDDDYDSSDDDDVIDIGDDSEFDRWPIDPCDQQDCGFPSDHWGVMVDFQII